MLDTENPVERASFRRLDHALESANLHFADACTERDTDFV
jgi:hypothetical protein